MLPITDIPKLADIDRIVTSAYNPRRRFNPEKLAELRDSIKRYGGVLQPILVRPVIVKNVEWLEIVAGERRFRATKMAGLAHILVIERAMTDTEALEIAVIENAQREDLHPLEEAEGFENLRRAYAKDGAHECTADELGVKIGKSRTHVYNRLKLLDLVSDLRDAFYADEISATVAMKVARLPAPLQTKALAQMRKATVDGEDIRVKDANRVLKADFALRLDKARWSLTDTSLVASAGPCATCPRNTANDNDLFSDVEDAAMCLDRTCFQSKVLALNEREKAKARSGGLVVIEGDEASAMLKFGTSSDELNGDYVYMDKGLPALTGVDKNLQRLLGTLLQPSALFEHPKQFTLRHVVVFTKAVDALRVNGLLLNDPDKDRPKPKQPKASEATNGTSVATPRDTSQQEPTTDFSATTYSANGEAASPRISDEDVQRLALEIEWRTQAFKALHRDLMDAGYVEDRTASLTNLICEHGKRVLGDPHALAVMRELWGWEDWDDLAPTERNLSRLCLEMDMGQMDILLHELVALWDVTELAIDIWSTETSFGRVGRPEMLLTDLCGASLTPWMAIRSAVFSGQPSPIYPTNVPPPAGEQQGAAGQELGDTSPKEDTSQAPSAQGRKDGQQAGAADLKVTIDEAHWTGQWVKRKSTKKIGEVVDIEANGDLLVAFDSPSGAGVRNLVGLARHEVEVTPNQVKPAGLEQATVIWPFPGERQPTAKQDGAKNPPDGTAAATAKPKGKATAKTTPTKKPAPAKPPAKKASQTKAKKAA